MSESPWTRCELVWQQWRENLYLEPSTAVERRMRAAFFAGWQAGAKYAFEAGKGSAADCPHPILDGETEQHTIPFAGGTVTDMTRERELGHDPDCRGCPDCRGIKGKGPVE
jgi:hypothetical protein